MKKIFIVFIVSFLIFALSLNAKTDEKSIVRNVDGLTPQQLIGTPSLDQIEYPNVNRDILQVGSGEVVNHQMPVIFNYMDSMVEIVYLQEWLGTGMIINTLSFHASMTNTMNDARDLEIWLGLTSEDDLSNGWIDGTNLEQVYGGTILVPPGDSWVEIPLDVDFIYENIDNLVMLIITNDDEYYSNTDAWWCTDSGTPARTRVVFSDNATGWQFNAITGPWGSDQIRSLYPDVRFDYTPLGGTQTPDESTDVTFVADISGALETQIDWTCPTLNYGGTALTELLEMRVYRDSLLIYTDTSPTIGESGSYLDASVPFSGLHEYQVIGYNSYGEGFPVYGWPWVGEDMPGAVDNLVLTQTSPDALSGTLTWDNPATGSHGGPFNELILGYHIERSDSITFELSGPATSYIDDTIPISAYYCYTVVPYNVVGDGSGITSNLALIADADLLILENFSNSVPPTGWYIDGLGQTNWSSNANNFAGGTAPELKFSWAPEFYGMSRICSNTLDTSGMNTLALEFTHSLSHYDSGLPYTIGVATSSDGITWHNVWTIIPTEDIVYGTVDVEFTNADVGSATFQICLYFDGDSYFKYWWIDDVILTDDSLLLLPPENVAVDADLGLVTWDAPAVDTVGKAGTNRELTGYNVYLDGVLQGNTTELEWQYDVLLINGEEYLAGVEAVYDEGVSLLIEVPFTYSGVGAGNDLPLVTELNGNYPNPFNPETTISFSTTESTENTELIVFNLKGQKVRSLVDGKLTAGQHSVVWNGKNDSDNSVSSGVYFYKMKSGKFVATKKMILMK